MLNKIICWFVGHHWTSKAQEGIKPNPSEIAAGVAGFKSYSTMYGKRCGFVSKLNDRL